MTIRAVIWDLGGVLVRTEDPGPRVALARELGMTRAELEQTVFGCEASARAQLGQLPAHAFWESVCTALQYPFERRAELEQIFWSGDRLDTELVDFIRSLRPRYRTALLSNAFSDLRRYVESTFRIQDAFDVMVISAEVGLAKPDPQIFHEVIERLQVKPDQALFVDDMPENVEGARNLGLQAIRFRNSAQARAEVLAALDLKGKANDGHKSKGTDTAA